MRILWLFCLALLQSGCALDPRAAGGDDHVQLSISQIGHERWQADYRLPRAVTRLHFLRNNYALRHQHWRADAGFILEAQGSDEYLRREDGQPFSTARLQLGLDETDRGREYYAGQRLGPDARYLFSGHFYVADADTPGPLWPHRLHFKARAGEWIRLQAQAAAELDWLDSALKGSYVVFGRMPVERYQGVAMLIAPTVPEHLTRQIQRELPMLLAYYQRELALKLPSPPLVLLSANLDAPAVSQGGDALSGVVRFHFNGAAWREPGALRAQAARYLIAHELAHLWNAGLTTSDDETRAPWLHEGGADALAWQALTALKLASDGERRRALSLSASQCASALSYQPLSELRRGRAPYDCGTVIYQLLGAVSPGGLTGLSRALFGRAAKQHRRYSSADLFASARQLGRAPVIAEAEAFWQTPQSDAPAALQRLLARAGAKVKLGYDDIKREEARAMLTTLLVAAIRQDCRGAASLITLETGFVIEGLPRCHTLNAPRYQVSALAQTPLSDPRRALQSAEQACLRDGRLALGTTEKQLVNLPCPPRFPQRLWIEAWPALNF